MNQPEKITPTRLINAYESSKLLAISFLFKVVVVASHSSSLIYNVGNKHHRIKDAAFTIFIQRFVTSGISSISVPILFTISGYLFFASIKNGSATEFLDKFKRRFHTLVIPFLFWSLFGIAFFYFLQSIPFSKPFFTKLLIRDFTTTQWLYSIFVLPIAPQLWFIRDLIVLIVLSPLLYILLKKAPKVTLAICLILWLNNFRIQPFSQNSLIFFLAGGYFSVKKIPLQNLPKIKHAYFLLTLWFVLLVIKVALPILHIYSKWGLLLLHKFCVLLGIVAVWYTYDSIYKDTDIRKKRYYTLFKYSFWIFVTHQPLLHIIKKTLYYTIGFSNKTSMLIYVLTFCITIAIILPAGIVLRKYLPKLYFFSTGGR